MSQPKKQKQELLSLITHPTCTECFISDSVCKTSHKLLAKSCYRCDVNGLDCSLKYKSQPVNKSYYTYDAYSYITTQPKKQDQGPPSSPTPPVCENCAKANAECRTSHKILAKSCYRCDTYGLCCSLKFDAYDSKEDRTRSKYNIELRRDGSKHDEDGYDGDVETDDGNESN